MTQNYLFNLLLKHGKEGTEKCLNVKRWGLESLMKQYGITMEEVNAQKKYLEQVHKRRVFLKCLPTLRTYKQFFKNIKPLNITV
jgi:hypothetical protein